MSSWLSGAKGPMKQKAAQVMVAGEPVPLRYQLDEWHRARCTADQLRVETAPARLVAGRGAECCKRAGWRIAWGEAAGRWPAVATSRPLCRCGYQDPASGRDRLSGDLGPPRVDRTRRLRRPAGRSTQSIWETDAYGHRGKLQTRRLRSRHLWVIVASVFVWFVAFFTAGALLFVFPTMGAPARVDAIVVLGGSGDRLGLGMELARDDRAPHLVLSMGLPWLPPGICTQHVGPAKVICFQPNLDTTEGETEGASRVAEQHGWSSLILVTTARSGARTCGSSAATRARSTASPPQCPGTGGRT